MPALLPLRRCGPPRSYHHLGIQSEIENPPADSGFAENALIETLAVAAAGAWLGLRLKIPAGGLLVPMTVAALLQGAGYLTVTLPKGLLLLGYGAIGLSIGLRFSRDLLRRTVRALPEMLAA